MMKKLLIFMLAGTVNLCAKSFDILFQQITVQPELYNKTEFEITIPALFDNPYISSQVMLDMLIETPSGKELVLPCFYVNRQEEISVWNARFAPREIGIHMYRFKLAFTGSESRYSDNASFNVNCFRQRWFSSY